MFTNSNLVRKWLGENLAGFFFFSWLTKPGGRKQVNTTSQGDCPDTSSLLSARCNVLSFSTFFRERACVI